MKLNKFNNYSICLGSEELSNTRRMKLARRIFKKEHPGESIDDLHMNVWQFYIQPRGSKKNATRRGCIMLYPRTDESDMKEATSRIRKHLARSGGFSNFRVLKNKESHRKIIENYWVIQFDVSNDVNNIQAMGKIQTALSEHKW